MTLAGRSFSRVARRAGDRRKQSASGPVDLREAGLVGAGVSP